MNPAVSTILILFLAGWATGALILQFLALTSLRKLLSAAAAAPAARATSLFRPSSCILVPCHRISQKLERRIEAFCRLETRVVLGVTEADSETEEIIARCRQAHPNCDLHLAVVAGNHHGNRKVAKLIRMLDFASNAEIIVFCDGDVAVPPHYLDTVLSPFADPKVGAVTCPYRNVTAFRIPSRIDALLTNTIFLPSITLAHRLEGIRFGLGATIAVRRSALRDIGGLNPLLDRLADDYLLTARIAGAGYKLSLAPILLDHCCEDEQTLRSIWQRHVRWARTVRSVRPIGYLGNGITHGLPATLALSILILMNGAPPSIAFLPPLVWLGLRVGGLRPLEKHLVLRPRDLLILPLVEIIAFAVYLTGSVGREVTWAGRTLRIGRDSSIQAPTESL